VPDFYAMPTPPKRGQRHGISIIGTRSCFWTYLRSLPYQFGSRQDQSVCCLAVLSGLSNHCGGLSRRCSLCSLKDQDCLLSCVIVVGTVNAPGTTQLESIFTDGSKEFHSGRPLIKLSGPHLNRTPKCRRWLSILGWLTSLQMWKRAADPRPACWAF
jgi:hypothetical protein